MPTNERVREVLQLCIGRKLVKITCSCTGMMELAFDNGVQIEFSDSYGNYRNGDESGHCSAAAVACDLDDVILE